MKKKHVILTKSVAFTEAPLSQRSFTLEEQPAMTVEKKKEEKWPQSFHQLSLKYTCAPISARSSEELLLDLQALAFLETFM